MSIDKFDINEERYEAIKDIDRSIQNIQVGNERLEKVIFDLIGARSQGDDYPITWDSNEKQDITLLLSETVEYLNTLGKYQSEIRTAYETLVQLESKKQ